ncbi:DUF1963 domain-containing protein [Nocardia sp. NPDC058058]|uniref:DUF1963 domain-containing protein n=1 Tax=Nocardia sp. NPDC058058 TaxID=3346317 RepID=UPI0036DC3BC1
MSELDIYGEMRLRIPSELHAAFELSIRQALRLRHAGEGDAVIGYFGGLPELPEGVDWPGDDDGHYEHVATIDLATLPGLDLNLPASGRISVFGDMQGWSGAFRYFPADAVLREAPLPPDLLEADRIIRRVPMTYAVVPTMPPLEWLEEYLFDNGDYDDAAYEQLRAFGDGFSRSWSKHQLGGWAEEIQGNRDDGILPGTAAERHFHPDHPPTSAQILLTQFDTDLDIRMGWGDYGMLYCFIDSKALAAQDFTDVHVHWECH